MSWDDPYPGNENLYLVGLSDVETGRRLDRDIVPAGTNSWSTTGSDAFGRVRLGREYRVYVDHDAIPYTQASILVTTPDLPPSSRAAARAAAQTVDPLTLELASSRALCTANTLTGLSWTISGGLPPYTLTIDGETVDSEAESHRVNCGPIATDPETDQPVSDPTKTIRATITDTSATPDTATDEVLVDLAPPLAAPTGLRHSSYPEFVISSWNDVPNVGRIGFTNDLGYPDWIEAYAVRYRSSASSVWTHVMARRMSGTGVWEMPGPGIHVMSVAALRDPLELLTPGALQWSDSHSYATVQRPQNLVVAATHDTVTVRWDKQPHGGNGVVILRGPTGMLLVTFPRAIVPGRETVVLRDLPPSTELRVVVNYQTVGYRGGSTSTTVTTLAQTANYEPPPAGPQNLRAVATHNTITVAWDAARPGIAANYSVQAFRVDNGLRVHTQSLYGGETSVTITGNEFAFLTGNTFELWSDIEYEVVVRERGIPGKSATIFVRTLAAPAQAAERSSAQGLSDVDPFDPTTLYPFLPAWLVDSWWRAALITTDPTTWPHWVSALLSLQTRARGNH